MEKVTIHEFAQARTAHVAAEGLRRLGLKPEVADGEDGQLVIRVAARDVELAGRVLDEFERGLENGLEPSAVLDAIGDRPPPPVDLGELKTIAKVQSPAMVALLRADLMGAGIPHFIADEHMSSLYGGLLFGAIPYRVQVPAKLVDSALKVLREAERRVAAARATAGVGDNDDVE